MAEISYRGHRFPPIVIQHAVWLYLRFTLSYRDVEELLAERGLDVSYETVRSWVLKFGPIIARRLRRSRPRPSNRWHLDEVVVRIAGKHMYLWRAVDDEGEVLEILVQRRRDKCAAAHSRQLADLGRFEPSVCAQPLQRPCVRRSALTQCPTCNGRPPPAEGQGPLGSRGVRPLGARAPLSPGHHHFHPPAAKAGTDEPMALVENGGFDAVPSSHLGGIGTYRDAANVRLRSMAVLQVLESGGGSEIAESRAEDLTR